MLKKFKFGIIKNQSIGHLIINNLFLFKNDRKINYIFFYSSKESANLGVEYLIIKYLQNKKITCINLNKFFIKVVRKLYVLFKTLNLKFLLFDIEHIHRNNDYIKFGTNYKFFPEKLDYFKLTNFPKKQFDYFLKYKEHRLNNKKYVCIFYRSHHFYNEKKHENIRNSKFENLIPTINYLNSIGYKVVLLGNHENIKFEEHLNNKDFIFLSKSEKKNSWLELFLVKNAEYFITSNSGFSNIQFLFNTPMLVVNFMPIGLRIPYKNSYYILKKIKKNNKIVNYMKIEESLLLSEEKKHYIDLGYEILENTNNEILNAVKDMISKNLVDENIYKKYIPIVYGSEVKLCKSFLNSYINEIK